MRLSENGRREVVFRFSDKGGKQLLPPSMQPKPRTSGPLEPFSQAIYNVDRVGGSRGWTTSIGEYGSVKPFFDKEQSCGPETTKRLICDPNHPHWHTKPDPERAYVGLATSYMDLGQSMPPGSMPQPVFKLHSKTALYWPDWFGVTDPSIARIQRATKDPRVG
jgi:hypothetical protein